MLNQINTRVVTGKVRFAYVNIFTPRAIKEGQSPRYSLCILIPKEDMETLGKIKAAQGDAALLGSSIWGGTIPKNLKTPLRDGDFEMTQSKEFAGHYFLNAVSKYKPKVVDRNLSSITDPEEFYSGCFGRVSLNFYPYKNGDSSGIGCGLQNLQKLEDGEALYTGASPEEDFREPSRDLLGERP